MLDSVPEASGEGRGVRRWGERVRAPMRGGGPVHADNRHGQQGQQGQRTTLGRRRRAGAAGRTRRRRRSVPRSRQTRRRRAAGCRASPRPSLQRWPPPGPPAASAAGRRGCTTWHGLHSKRGVQHATKSPGSLCRPPPAPTCMAMAGSNMRRQARSISLASASPGSRWVGWGGCWGAQGQGPSHLVCLCKDLCLPRKTHWRG